MTTRLSSPGLLTAILILGIVGAAAADFVAEDELPVRRGLVAHLDASALSGHADGAPVSVWPDGSGNGHHGVPSGAGGAPSYRSAAIGGRPAVRFDGVDDNMVLGTVRDETGGLELFMVAAGPSATGGNWQRLASAWSGIAGQNDWTMPSWQISRPNAGGVPSVFAAEVFRIGYASGYEIDHLTLAASSQNPASNNLDGDIAEVVLFSQPLTAEERSKVGAYLQHKYGIAMTYAHPGTGTVRAESVSGLGTSSATVFGMLDSSGSSPAEVRLYYGTSEGGCSTTAWQHMAVVATAQAGMGLPQSVVLSGLLADTTYYARMAVGNSDGISFSADVLSFTTTPPTVSVADCVVYEGGSAPVATFVVSLSQSWGSATTVQYATVDGTAQADGDYQAVSGALVIPAETLSGTVEVPVRIDGESELPEQFQLRLLDAGASAIADDTGTCTILDVYAAYHVATDGNDASPGTLAQPFATIEHARDVLAEVYANGLAPEGGVTVWIRGGRYPFAESIVFGGEHAGTAAAPITYRAHPGEEVRLSGGLRLQAAWFSPVTDTDTVWARLDAAARGQVVKADLGANGIADFGTLLRRGFGKDGVMGALELFVDGQPQQLARWPNGEEFARLVTAVSTTQFTYSGTRPERWTQAEAPWAHGYWYHMWADEHLAVSAIDTATKTVTLDGTHSYGTKANQPYYFYNLLEEIDLPGEWYLNRTAGVLYYWPATALAEAEIEVSMAEGALFRIAGANHLRFADLVFECTRGELVRIDSGTGNRVERCLLRNCGTNAAFVAGTGNGLDDCRIHQTGAGGAKLSGGDRNTLTDALNYVTNCDIHHFGRWCWTYAPAVRPTGCGHRVENNHIWHAPHTAILFAGNRISVKRNLIHDVCRFSSDAGAIYTGRDWGGRGCEVSYNFVHGISSTFEGHGVHGIYLDDVVSGLTVHGNILYEITGHAIQHGGGRDNILTNNVMKNCGDGVAADSRGTGWAYNNINARAQDSWDLLHKLRLLGYRSPVWTAAYPECAAIPDDYNQAYSKANGWLTPGGSVLARNVYCNLTKGLQYTSDNAFSYYATIADNLEVCSPLFVDEANLNMTLAADSPALLVPGFENIAFGDIGPQRQIEIQGNAVIIANGDTTPSLADHTDFGSAAVGDPASVRTFAIRNPGDALLSLTGTPVVEVSGTHAADFVVSVLPAATVPAGETTTFQIAFSPATTGLRTATLTIRSNDIDNSPFTFAVQGTGKTRSALYPFAWDPQDTDPQGRFLHDFGHAGYHAGQEPIPDSPPGPVVDATQAPYHADPNGTTDSTAAIQQALDDVGEGGGGVVYLPAGRYLISLPSSQGWALRIRHPRTVLRGAGNDRTFLENTSTYVRSASVILVRPDVGYVLTPLADTTRYLASDAPNRATVLQLDGVEGIAVGDRVVLRSDWTQEFIDEHGMTGVWAPSSSMSSALFFRRIVAIEGNSVTLDTPVRYPMKVRDNARLYRCAPFLGEVGLEDFSIGNRQHPGSGWGDNDYTIEGTGAYDVHGSHLVNFYHVWDGWMRRVHTFRPASNPGIFHSLSNIAIINRSRFVTFEDCVVQRTQYEGGGGNGYGLSFQDCNDCLMTGCEVIHTRHNYDFKSAGANGNVVHRSAGRTPRLASDFHMYLSVGNLFDCMTMDGDFLECRYRPYGAGPNLHGHAGTQNVFWNTYGTAARSDKVVESRQYGYGYVIGTSGPTSTVVLNTNDGGIDTSPIDWSESIGTGDRLYPESLYEDQLARRASLLPRVVDGLPQLTHRSAVLNATLANRNAQAVLFWGARDGGMMPDAWEHRVELGTVAIGPLSAELTGLLPVTTYFYRWLVWNEDGEDWADSTGSFTTLAGPLILGAGATLATTTTGTFHAELLGVESQVTLYWGTSDGGTDPDAWEHAVGPVPQAIGPVAIPVAGLPPFALVRYRWFAVGNGIEAWSPATETVSTTPVLTVADIEVDESAGSAVFAVVLAPVSTLETTVEVATEDDTALAGSDYVALARTVVIPAGEISAAVEVPILDNLAVEACFEEFRLLLSHPASATIATPSAIGTIRDDDLPPVPVTDGLVLHLDASSQAGILADGTASATWPDSSGLGHHAATDAGSPVWRERAINGRPAFLFDGASATFLSPSIRPEAGDVSVLLVSEKETTDGGTYQRLVACDNGESTDWIAPNWAISSPAGTGGAPLAYPPRLDSRYLGANYGIGPVRLGRMGVSASGWLHGKIGEVLVYDRSLSTAERSLVSSWLQAKYAISGFTVAPETALKGNGLAIANGDATPEEADGTDFGQTPGTSRVFHIHNLGTDALTISLVAVDSAPFSVASPPAQTVLAPGHSTPFTIAFAPTDSGVKTATVTVLGSDGPYAFAVRGERGLPHVQAPPDFEVHEESATAVFTIQLSQAVPQDVTVEVATQDGNALAGTDYVAQSRTVTIPAGETSADVAVAILDDYKVEKYRKDFRLVLANPANADLGASETVCTVLDGDLPPVPVTDGLVLHLDASSLAGTLADGAASASWPDSSGLGNHAATDAGSPVWRERAINERPAFVFDAVSATFLAPSIRTELGAVTAYVLSERDEVAGGTYQRILACLNGAANDYTAPNWNVNGYTAEPGGGAPAAYPARLDSRRHGSGFGIGPIRIARQGTSASGWYAGEIGEVLVYGRYLNTDEDALVKAWLHAKYAVDGFVPAPAIILRGNGLTIADGDDAPAVEDGTDFGESTGASRIFEIHNLGTDELTIASVAEDSSHFSVSAGPAKTSLAPGESTAFTITYAPTSRGTHAATVTVLGNGGSRTFAIRGEWPGPQLHVKQGESVLASAAQLDFGSMDLSGPAVSRTLTVTNLGTSDLVLTHASLDAPGAFSISGFVPDTVLAPAGSTTFDLRFAPVVNGPHAVAFQLGSNDASQSPFSLALAGTATTAPLALPATDPTPDGFTANWSPVDRADGYRLDVATSDAFATLVEGYDNRDVGAVTSLVLADLPTGDHCHYRIRAVFGTAASVDSNTVRGDRQPDAPGAFTIPLADQLVPAGTQLSPAWGPAADADGDAVSHVLQFHDGSDWADLPAGQPHILPAGIDAHVRYRVRAEAGGLVSPWTESPAVHLDGIAPTVQSVAVPPAMLYRFGDELVVTVAISEPVLVTGSPALAIVLGMGTVSAAYDSGTSTDTQLVFRHAVQATDRADGIGVGPLDLAGGAIRDAAGNDLDPALHGMGDPSQIRVVGGPLLLHVDASGGDDAHNGLAWGQALESLATALAFAIPGDEIWVRAGEYAAGEDRADSFVLQTGVAVYGGFDGTEISRAQRDIAANPTVLSGDSPYHVLRNPAGVDRTAILDGFTIAGGNADGGDPGGGMLNLGASPTIRNCHFVGNRGIALANLSGSAPAIESCTFSANHDAAVLNQGSVPAFLNCTFTANPDGAVRNAAASPASFVHCTFSGNDGGALHDESTLDPTLLNCIFHGNGGGHGISGTIAAASVRRCLIQGGGYGDATCRDGDPRLAPLGANGGPVPTMAPGHFSAALDGATSGATVDARGESRPFGSAADLGAHEATVPLLVASAPAPGAIQVPVQAALTLVFQCPVTPVADIHLLLRIVGGDIVESIPVTRAETNGRTAVFTFASPLGYATRYCIQLEAGAFSGSGGNPAVADETTLVFTTVDPPVYRVRFLVDETPGASLDGTLVQDVVLGQNTAPVEALPPLGHHFVKWTRAGGDYGTANPLTVFGVDADMDLLAHFAPDTFTWTFQPGSRGALAGGAPHVAVTVAFGDPAPVAPAVAPEAGYSHAGWSAEIPATVGLGDLEFVAQYKLETYTWTFHPGAHGALAGGEPDVSVAVTFGEPAPVPPAVVPEHGYRWTGWSDEIPAAVGVGPREFTALYERIRHALTVEHGSGSGEYVEGAEIPVSADERIGMSFAGWTTNPPDLAEVCLADPASPETLFTMPGETVVLTATYTFDEVAWTVAVSLADAAVTTVVLGMHAAASDGPDAGLDVMADAGSPLVLASDDLARFYATELRAPADRADFLLVATAGETVATLSWDLADLPAGKVLSMFRVHLDQAGRGETSRLAFGNTARNMATTAAVEIPAGETHGYVIRFADEQAHDLLIRRGWNLLSLPAEPSDPRPEAVFGGAAGVHAHRVMWWHEDAYEVATEMRACLGYWVYAEEPTVLLVMGMPVLQEELVLLPGWNLRGTTRPRILDPPVRDAATAWRWHPERLRYSRGTLLLPGEGYWIRVVEETTVPLVDP